MLFREIGCWLRGRMRGRASSECWVDFADDRSPCAPAPSILAQPIEGIDLLTLADPLGKNTFFRFREEGLQMRWRFTVSIASVGVLLMALGCQKGGSSGEIPVGEYSSLTGTTATFGQSTHNAILMAFDEINAAGGVLGKKVRDYVEDDQSKPEEAAIAATKLI